MTKLGLAFGTGSLRRLDLLIGYETAVATANNDSGLRVAMEVCYWSGEALRRTISRIAEAEALTLEGVRLKAQAMVAARAIEDLWQGNAWAGPRLADAVLAVLGEAGR